MFGFLRCCSAHGAAQSVPSVLSSGAVVRGRGRAASDSLHSCEQTCIADLSSVLIYLSYLARKKNSRSLSRRVPCVVSDDEERETVGESLVIIEGSLIATVARRRDAFSEFDSAELARAIACSVWFYLEVSSMGCLCRGCSQSTRATFPNVRYRSGSAMDL